MQPGDIILEINGENTADMLNVEAQNKIKNSKTQLQLVVERYDIMLLMVWLKALCCVYVLYVLSLKVKSIQYVNPL